MDGMPRTDRATFRLPAVALFVPALLFFCIAPLATSGGWWALFFVVPLAALAWVLLTRTTVTPVRVSAHGLLGSRRMDWTDLDRLEFQDSRWAIAVALDGRRLRLPMVRPRDLPRLAAVSGGSLRLGEDAPAPDEATDEPSTDTATATAGSVDDTSLDTRAPDDSVADQAAPDDAAEPAEQQR